MACHAGQQFIRVRRVPEGEYKREEEVRDGTVRVTLSAQAAHLVDAETTTRCVNIASSCSRLAP